MTQDKREISSQFLNPKIVTKEHRDGLKKMLLQNPEYAIQAISARNKTIKELKTINDHMLISAQENLERLNEATKIQEEDEKKISTTELNIKNALESLENKEKQLQDLIIIKNSLQEKYTILNFAYDTLMKEKESSILNKLNILVENLPAWTPFFIKAILTLLVHKTTSKYVCIVSFLIIFWASLVGWNQIIIYFKPLLTLIGL